jgi:hypothetical protein
MNNGESERARLKRLYSGLSDAGLMELAQDAASLTELAREVLSAEMGSRGIAWKFEPASGTNKEATEPRVEKERSPRGISGPLVMVKRYRDMPEAAVAESILDSAGIDCFLADENTIRMDWLWSNLLGGFKLMVRPEDLEEAKKLLEQSAIVEAEAEEGAEKLETGTGEAENENH